MTQVSKWDERFMEMAMLVSGWSKDPSTKVGAVIVDIHNRIVSTGYNGFPAGISDDYTGMNRLLKNRRTIHAEENAIIFAQRNLAGCTIYVTEHPCASCAAKIVQSGICHVVTRKPIGEFADNWSDDIEIALQIITTEARTKITYLERT